MTAMYLRQLACFAALAMAGCAGPATQILLPPVQSEMRVRPVVGSLEVRDVSLPRYAASDEILFLNAGALDPVRDAIWADTPDAALTAALADALATITGARVATEPWPFAAPPSATLSVRITRLTAAPGAGLDLVGSYAIAPVASGLSDRSGRFVISVPVAGDTPQALAEAQSRALAELAETVAGRLAR